MVLCCFHYFLLKPQSLRSLRIIDRQPHTRVQRANAALRFGWEGKDERAGHMQSVWILQGEVPERRERGVGAGNWVTRCSLSTYCMLSTVPAPEKRAACRVPPKSISSNLGRPWYSSSLRSFQEKWKERELAFSEWPPPAASFSVNGHTPLRLSDVNHLAGDKLD